MSKEISSLHYTYVPRKIYDRNLDRLKEKLGQQKARIVALEQHIYEIKDFLANGPHACAWEMFKSSRK